MTGGPSRREPTLEEQIAELRESRQKLLAGLLLAIACGFLFTVGLNWLSQQQRTDDLLHGCERGNVAKAVQYEFIRAVGRTRAREAKIRATEARTVGTTPRARRAILRDSKILLAAHRLDEHLASRIADSVAPVHLRGANPATTDCNKAFPSPGLFG